MNANPYAPPNSHVEDIPPPEARGLSATRPKQVEWAFRLLIASSLLSVLGFFLGHVQGVVIPVVVVSALLGFAFAIRTGMNWARLLFLVLYFLGLPGLFFPQTFIAVGGIFYFLLYCSQTLLQGAALWFSFRKPGSAWFRRPRGVRPSGRNSRGGSSLE